MVDFRDEFATKFDSTTRVRELTLQFEKIKPEEFKKIQKQLKRFKLKKIQI